MKDTMPLDVNYQALCKALLKECACPIHWVVNNRTSDFADLMKQLWMIIATCFEVEDEADWTDDESLDVLMYQDIVAPTENDIEELKSQLINVRYWVEKARELYIDRTRRLWKLRVADRTTYSKHYPATGLTIDEIVRLSRASKRAFLFPGIDASVLQEVLWEGLSCIVCCYQSDISQADLAVLDPQEWTLFPDRYGLGIDNYRLKEREKEFLNIGAFSSTELDWAKEVGPLWVSIMSQTDVRLVFDMIDSVGATNGAETRFLCFELNLSTPIAHAYPVSENEARNIMGKEPLPVLDDLQGYYSRRPDWDSTPIRPFGEIVV